MHSRFPIQWAEDGDSVQAAAGERAADHLPPLLPPAAHLLRHHLLQTFLLRGSGDCEPYRDAGHHNALRQVGGHHHSMFCFSIHVKFISNVVFPVSWGSFQPLPTFVWWTFGSYLDNSSPLWRNDNHLNNIICLKTNKPHLSFFVPHLFYIFRLFSSQLLSFITKKITISIIMDSWEMFPRTRGGSQNRSRMWQR